MIIITPSRVKAIISDCKTDVELTASLRRHRIRFWYSTDTGFLSVIIPCSTGKVRVYKTASRSSPFRIAQVMPTPFYYRNA